MIRIEQLLRRSARLFPNDVAVRDCERDVTWSGLLRETEDLARALAGIGIGKGDRVVVLGRNRTAYVELYFACAMLSAVLVPLNTRLLPREIAGLVERSRARCAIADVRLARGLLPLPAGCRGFLFAEPGEAGAGAGELAGWSALAALGPDGSLPEPGDANEVAVQMYTSGTTGLPKGAMLTHANVTAMALAWLLEVPLRSPADTFMQVTPLYHVGATLMMTTCFAAGARYLLQPEFAPAAVARALSEEGVTHTLLVPSMIRFLLDKLGDAEVAFPHLRTVVYGASPIPTAQLERARERFGCDLVQGYGLTETAGVLTALRPEDHRHDPSEPAPARFGSAGRPVLGVEIRVVASDGRDVAPGEIGEIVARGPNVFVGYHDMPEATAEAFRDGWFHTGDLGTLDADGYVSIVDRSKDMIITGGENVYPSEVEAALRKHALVSDVTVIGVPHDTWGESVLALVVPASEVIDPDEAVRSIVLHTRKLLAGFKCPSKVTFVQEIPRNAAGKVLKAQLRAPYWVDRERRV
jgi:long-chain acyl-CoA synthetase